MAVLITRFSELLRLKNFVSQNTLDTLELAIGKEGGLTLDRFSGIFCFLVDWANQPNLLFVEVVNPERFITVQITFKQLLFH